MQYPSVTLRTSFLATTLAATLGIVGTISAAEAQAGETLTYATNTAPTGLRGEAEKGFIDALNEVSGGELEVVPYWGASVLKGDETLNGVKSGVADMGFININYYPNQLLLNSAFQIFPEGPESYAGKMKAYHEIYDQVPQLADEFAKQGQHIVYLYPYLPYAGVFNEPVTSFDDFEGLRIRASSQWVLNLLGGLGATPVSVPWSDTYQSLQSGAIDGVFTNYDSLSRTGMDEVAPHILTTKRLWVAVPMIITINQQKWDAMSDEQKGWFKDAAAKAEKSFGEYYSSEFDRIVKQEKDAGYTVTAASQEDVDRFASLPAVKKNRDTWIDSAKQDGAADPSAIIEQMQSIIDSAGE
ncbi:TRAP transporter substrate-binding protein DctP [Salinicola rhizosphaerae]|uniref:C4-dicarboxylate ABC transporter n=1 Tax=Salinicola rhizosphaerae TaxID=1443141 RepID=A0ABQ3DPY2_9GAMM|nr:TRAP transporter substrate-binding protein DctP [Salinicola rhizosphaerae]GHB11147.1 C4-dicarboxylate ABC transporter [Salinicola rhizosphaerae]